MARVFIILLLAAVCIGVAMVIYSAGTRMIEAGERSLKPMLGKTEDGEMAPTGIQKAAYVALIVVLFGVASGWLGGM